MNARQSAVCGWEWQRVWGGKWRERVTGAVGRGGGGLTAGGVASGFEPGCQRVEKKPMAVQAMAMAAAMRDSPAMKPEAVGTA